MAVKAHRGNGANQNGDTHPLPIRQVDVEVEVEVAKPHLHQQENWIISEVFAHGGLVLLLKPPDLAAKIRQLAISRLKNI